MFIKPIGIINPGSHSVLEQTITEGEMIESEDTIPLSSSGAYTVKSGDTLSGIAGALQISWQDLASANGIEPPYSLSVGQELKLP